MADNEKGYYISLNGYCDINRVIIDIEYAKKLHLKVICVNGIYLIKYIKEYINDENVNSLGLFRSVIVDNKGKILCYSPPKSMPYGIFQNDYCNEVDNVNVSDKCNVTYMIDGTMINVFWNPIINDWELATRSNIGANCRYNTTNTFRYMFLDCMNHINMSLSELNKDCCYSFVFQHPDNKIVKHIIDKKIYLINVYKIIDNVIFKVTDIDYMPKNIYLPTIIRINENINNFNNLKDYVNEYSLKIKDKQYEIPGIMITDKVNSKRMKFRNPEYEKIKKLKGNSNKLQFTYYTLRQKGMVTEYLKYYNEHFTIFNTMRLEMHNFTDILYNSYVSCFINKEKYIKEYPYEYIPHLSALHTIYLDKLKPNQLYVRRTTVINYVNNLKPERLMFVINYKKR